MICDATVAYVYPPKQRRDGLAVVSDDVRIRIRDVRSRAGQRPFRYEVTHETDHFVWRGSVGAKAVDNSRHSNLVADHDVMQRLPSTNRQERVVPGDFDRATRSRGDLETRLDAAVHPGGNLVRLDSAIRCKAVNLWYLPPDRVFDGQPLASLKVDNETITFNTLSHRRSSCDDDQVAVLESAGHAVQVVKSRRDPDDPLPALHLQRDPLHGRAQQVVQARQLSLIAVVRDAEHQ